MYSKTTDLGIIEFLREGGAGSEANVKVELRTKFQGLGGTLVTQEGVVTAFRMEHSTYPKQGHLIYLRHLVVKKLDDFYYRTKVYNYAHVPRPLGSVSEGGENPVEAYIYEWAFGNEGFPWEIPDGKGKWQIVKLRDWDVFVNSFHTAGIEVGYDVTDSDNGRISKNIIYQLPYTSSTLEMGSVWKRIDFGNKSLPINYDKLLGFLDDKRKDIVDVLGRDRLRMMTLAAEFLKPGGGGIGESDIGRLEILVGEYRSRTLRHLISGVAGLDNGAVYDDSTFETLL